METTEDLQSRLTAAERRAEDAERRLAVAKKELLKLSTDLTPEDLERAKGVISDLEGRLAQRDEEANQLLAKLGDLGQEVQRYRVSYLSGELDNSLLKERIAEVEEQLATVVKPLSVDDQQLVMERSLSWMALQDPMTRLANANRLDLELEQAVTRAQGKDVAVVLMLLDLDGFHQVNEIGGWRVGNLMIQEIAQRLGKLVQGSPTFVARRGEDEFALVFSVDAPTQQGRNPNLETPIIRVRQLADLVLQVFDLAFEIEGQRMTQSASMGLSIFPHDADAGAELLENAHAALASAKQEKRGSYVIFSDRVYLEREQRTTLGTELREAVESGRLNFSYRPIVSASRGTVAAGQVETAWDHPVHGKVALSDFLSMADGLGLTHRIAMQGLEAGLALSRKIKGSLPVIVPIPDSVLARAELVKEVLDSLNRSRTRPEALMLEIPVSAFERRPRETRAFLDELGRWRIGSAISGLGQSAIPLWEIQQAKPDVVTLSPELTERVTQGDTPAVMVKNLLSLFKGIGVSCRAVKVSHQSQCQFLTLHGCDSLSGDFLALSASIDEFVSRKRSTWKLR